MSEISLENPTSPDPDRRRARDRPATRFVIISHPDAGKTTLTEKLSQPAPAKEY